MPPGASKRVRRLAAAGAGFVLLAVARAGPSCAGPPPPAGSAPPDLVTVQPGVFPMGSAPSDPDRREDECLHEVALTRPFALARTEVTQALWRSVMGGDPGYFAGCDDCPVESVSWLEAVRFCNELSRRQALAPAYAVRDSTVTWDRAAAGYRLPTEAEWEFACRAGAATAYAGGACLSDRDANYNAEFPPPGCPDGMSRGEPVATGSFPPNAWGFHDMHGNVAEWCWDWYGAYPAGRAVDPAGPARGDRRVFRGGAWANHAPRLRCACREALRPARRLDMIGLRVARTVAP